MSRRAGSYGWIVRFVSGFLFGRTSRADKSDLIAGEKEVGAQAWRGFLEIFGGLSDHPFPGAMRVVHRFIKYTHPLPEVLLRAFRRKTVPPIERLEKQKQRWKTLREAV